MQVPIKPVNVAPSSPGRRDVSLMTRIILLVTRPTEEPRPGNRFCYRNTSITRLCFATAKYETMQNMHDNPENKWIFCLAAVTRNEHDAAALQIFMKTTGRALFKDNHNFLLNELWYIEPRYFYFYFAMKENS